MSKLSGLSYFLIGEYVGDYKCIVPENVHYTNGILNNMLLRKYNNIKKHYINQFIGLRVSSNFGYKKYIYKFMTNIVLIFPIKHHSKYLYTLSNCREILTIVKQDYNECKQYDKIIFFTKYYIKLFSSYVCDTSQYIKLIEFINDLFPNYSKSIYSHIFERWIDIYTYDTSHYKDVINYCVKYNTNNTRSIFKYWLTKQLTIYELEDIIFSSVLYGYYDITKLFINYWTSKRYSLRRLRHIEQYCGVPFLKNNLK